MFTSLVTQERCACFTVLATDLRDYSRVVLPYWKSFKDASMLALELQSTMDPLRKSFDFRVHQCS